MITKYKLFERKSHTEYVELFLELYNKFNKQNNTQIYIPYKMKFPIEIYDELDMLGYFYLEHTDSYSWHKHFDYGIDYSKSGFKNAVKKYIGERISEKWNNDYNIFKTIETLNMIEFYKKNYSQNRVKKMFSSFFYNLMKKSPPKKLIKQRKFNL